MPLLSRRALLAFGCHSVGVMAGPSSLGCAGKRRASGAAMPAGQSATRPTAGKQFSPHDLTAAERAAIVADAAKALREHMQDQQKPSNVEISEKRWGPALRRLKPIRLCNDRVNVMITLVDDAGQEEGLYVNLPISSYIPEKDRFVAFESLSQPQDGAFGSLHYYRLRKPADKKQGIPRMPENGLQVM